VNEVAALVRRVRATRLPDPARRRALRVDAGLSLRDVGEALHTDPVSVMRWERGSTPRPSMAASYAKLLQALERECHRAAS